MRNSFICLHITFLLVVTSTNVVFGQAKSGHFKYGLISYEIIDSQEMQGATIDETLSFLIDHLHAEVYFNESWFVVLNKEKGGIRKSMYNRKSRVVYFFYDDPKSKSLRIDSIYTFYEKDAVLSATKDTFRDLMGITIAKEEVSLMNGFKCHKEYHTEAYAEEQALDEIWVTTFLKVPNLVFDDNLYFFNEGIPLKVVQDFVVLKITWGVVEYLPLSRKDKIFTFDQSGYSSEIFDSKSLMYEGLHFLRTYEPNPKSN